MKKKILDIRHIKKFMEKEDLNRYTHNENGIVIEITNKKKDYSKVIPPFVWKTIGIGAVGIWLVPYLLNPNLSNFRGLAELGVLTIIGTLASVILILVDVLYDALYRQNKWRNYEKNIKKSERYVGTEIEEER